jgi:hypothetical protein
MPDYTFDRQSQRYRNKATGKFIGQTKIEELTRKAIRSAEDEILQVADQLIQEKISIADWQAKTAKHLKQLHIQQYLLGRGGQKMMIDADLDIITAKLKQEFGYLDAFGQDIKSGMSVAQFEARVNLYLKNGRSSYQLARRQGHQESGHTYERRRLGAAEHCQPCLGYADRGWQESGQLPNIGSECDCRANCKCFFEFSKEKPDSIRSQRFGWIGTRFDLSLNILG